jgi:hypothetical protein
MCRAWTPGVRPGPRRAPPRGAWMYLVRQARRAPGPIAGRRRRRDHSAQPLADRGEDAEDTGRRPPRCRRSTASPACCWPGRHRPGCPRTTPAPSAPMASRRCLIKEGGDHHADAVVHPAGAPRAGAGRRRRSGIPVRPFAARPAGEMTAGIRCPRGSGRTRRGAALPWAWPENERGGGGQTPATRPRFRKTAAPWPGGKTPVSPLRCEA